MKRQKTVNKVGQAPNITDMLKALASVSVTDNTCTQHPRCRH